MKTTSSSKYESIYQFKIILKHIMPKIWRRIQVPENYTFWDLHVAIQDAMGWYDCHLHEFDIKNPNPLFQLSKQKVRIGIPDEDFSDPMMNETKPGWEKRIADYFTLENKKANYTYDFGDNWEHEVTLEKILPREENKNYPLCIDGERACPPEDCGSIPGYYELLEILNNPKNRRHQELTEWLGRKYDPGYFDPEEISFDNPEERLKQMQENS